MHYIWALEEYIRIFQTLCNFSMDVLTWQGERGKRDEYGKKRAHATERGGEGTRRN
jgi:hypothetical protein